VPVAPIETPTGREAAAGVFPGEDAIPGLWELTGELPLTPALAPPAAPAGALAELALAGALLATRGAPPLDLVMSTPGAAAEALAPPTSEDRPDVLADPAPRAGPARLVPSDPLVPCVRGGAFGSEAPSRTSGSSNSADANNSVGISPESAGACGTGVFEGGEAVEVGEAAGASGPRSSSKPCASKSSSESNRPFDGAVGGDAVVDDAVGVGGEGRPPPACDAVPFNPKGSSTGRSAKGSKAGREAASIVFEPARAINPERILQCRRRGT
jgi:hypothetical protein